MYPLERYLVTEAAGSLLLFTGMFSVNLFSLLFSFTDGTGWLIFFTVRHFLWVPSLLILFFFFFLFFFFSFSLVVSLFHRSSVLLWSSTVSAHPTSYVPSLSFPVPHSFFFLAVSRMESWVSLPCVRVSLPHHSPLLCLRPHHLPHQRDRPPLPAGFISLQSHHHRLFVLCSIPHLYPTSYYLFFFSNQRQSTSSSHSYVFLYRFGDSR